jgi:hypothetical protein
MRHVCVCMRTLLQYRTRWGLLGGVLEAILIVVVVVGSVSVS